MRDKIIIVMISFVLAFSFFYFIFEVQQANVSLTGFAILNNSANESSNVGREFNLNTTEQQAIESIEEAREIIIEMKESNFSILYVNDTLIEAERVLKQARNAEILRNKSYSVQKKNEARRVLELIEWEEITYNSVIALTDKIKERKTQGFIILDSISAIEISLYGFAERGINISEDLRLIGEAKNAFYKDRYGEAEEFLDKIRENLKLKNLSFSTFSAIQRGARTFVEKYWRRYWYIFIVILALISVTGFFAQRGIKKKVWSKKIRKLKRESKVLINLIKKVQEDRFKYNKISELVYNIRMKNYKNKFNKIKARLPVLESKLKKISISQGFLKVESGYDNYKKK